MVSARGEPAAAALRLPRRDGLRQLRQREQLRVQALTDELTGLFNRRHFEHCLSSVLRDERDRGGPTSVVYFDVDAFKAINDTFGHAAGDQVLREFSEVLQRAEPPR